MLLEQLPRDSATMRALGGPDSEWTLEAHLQAAIVDALNVANWQRAARKHSRPPTPIPRPGVHDPNTRKIGTTALPVDELRARLKARETAPADEVVSTNGD